MRLVHHCRRAPVTVFKGGHAVRGGPMGFSLIELLIVVAIIGILVAIAAPNYQDAIIRSKVAKFQGDAKAVETAIETYQTDFNSYPYSEVYPADSDCYVQGLAPTGAGTGYLPVVLTTPAGYIGKLPKDPFTNREDTGNCFPPKRTYLYSYDGQNANIFRMNFVSITYAYAKGERTVTNVRPTNAQWMVGSCGPDEHRDMGPQTGTYPHTDRPTYFDPTNGTISPGDLYYFGPGIGF